MQAITRIGQTRAWWRSVCAGMPLKAQLLGHRRQLAVKASLVLRCHAGRVIISPIRNACIEVGQGAAITLDQMPCGAEYSMKSCLIPRSEKRLPQPSWMAGLPGIPWVYVHISWLAMPPSSNWSSEPSSKIKELSSMQARRLGYRGCGNQIRCDELDADALVVCSAFVSSVTTKGASKFDYWDMISSWENNSDFKMDTLVLF